MRENFGSTGGTKSEKTTKFVPKEKIHSRVRQTDMSLILFTKMVIVSLGQGGGKDKREGHFSGL
jgi:hypothetical protein